MSLSGSTGEDYNKTNDAQLRFNDALPPDATPENPGAVHPDVGSVPAVAGSVPGSGAPDHGGDVRGVFGNPEMFKDTFSDLSGAFTKAIQAIEDESPSGVGTVGKTLIKRLKEIRAEVDGWRKGEGLEGLEGEKNEDVDKRDGEGGGLYAD